MFLRVEQGHKVLRGATASLVPQGALALLPADVASLAEGTSPSGLPGGAIEGRTDFGMPDFGGACPPERAAAHRYVFTIFAIPEQALPLDETASGEMVGFFARTTAIAHASLTVTCGH